MKYENTTIKEKTKTKLKPIYSSSQSSTIMI